MSEPARPVVSPPDSPEAVRVAAIQAHAARAMWDLENETGDCRSRYYTSGLTVWIPTLAADVEYLLGLLAALTEAERRVANLEAALAQAEKYGADALAELEVANLYREAYDARVAWLIAGDRSVSEPDIYAAALARLDTAENAVALRASRAALAARPSVSPAADRLRERDNVLAEIRAGYDAYYEGGSLTRLLNAERELRNLYPPPLRQDALAVVLPSSEPADEKETDAP